LNEYLGILFSQLYEINKQIVDLEAQGSEGNKAKISKELATKNHELKVHETVKPQEEKAPEESTVDPQLKDQIRTQQEKVASLETKIKEVEAERTGFVDKREALERIKSRAKNIQASFDNFMNAIEADCKTVGLDNKTIATLTINLGEVERIHKEVLEVI